MKKLMVLFICIFAAALFTGNAAMAQTPDITGQWQGTLHAPGHDLRTVVKISKSPDGKLAAVMYSIDQPGGGIGASSVSLDGSTVKYAVSAIDGSFEGTLSVDGKTIDGKWTQGPGTLDLTLVRATADTAWALPAPPKHMTATDPSFEVATIKLSPPDQRGKAFRIMPGGQFQTINTTLSDLISFAYGMHPKQVINAPDWSDKDKFDIVGKPDADGIPDPAQVNTMLQKLLVSRFQLKFHKDTRELSVYELVPAKDGPKLAATAVQGGNLPGFGLKGLGDVVVRNATMADFAGFMQTTVLDKPVVDHTGLTGKYDFELKWTPDQSQFESFGGIRTPPAETADAPPDLYTAIQQQLGLKINSTKAPTQVMVIGSATKPTAN